MVDKKWRRYRFTTMSVEDYRPLIFNPKYPWWCSGYSLTGAEGGPNIESAVIIAYLPEDEDLAKYWDDADDVEFTEHDKIEFSGRFPKPEYFEET